MDHLAIMKKSWGLLLKIVSGEKVIESRWYKNRYAPWDRIVVGESVYFKTTGEPVTVKAKVAKVLQFANLTPARVKNLLEQYGHWDGICTEDVQHYAKLFADKRYCLLVFLEDAVPIVPFQINKTGFGAMSAWITLPSIDQLRQQ